jgi:hypothetical protein
MKIYWLLQQVVHIVPTGLIGLIYTYLAKWDWEYYNRTCKIIKKKEFIKYKRKYFTGSYFIVKWNQSGVKSWLIVVQKNREVG